MTVDPFFQLIVDSAALAQIGAQGAREYPAEACGVLYVEDGELRVQPFENMQDKLHALDPERYTRTSREAYNMNTLKLNRFMGSHDVRAIYHTHVECGSYFSDEDQLCALDGDTGEALYPGLDYLVVSIVDRRARSADLYRYSPETRRFEAVAGTAPRTAWHPRAPRPARHREGRTTAGIPSISRRSSPTPGC